MRVIRNAIQGILLVALVITLLAFSGCSSVPQLTPERESFTFVQLCDPQLGMGGYDHDVATFRQAVTRINALNPDFAVVCGDLVASPNETSIRDFKAITAGLSVPCHLVPGNHDVFHGPLDRSMGFSPQDSLQHYRKSFGKDYYTFEHKGYQFVCVNTQLWRVSVPEESERHDQWVKEALLEASRSDRPVFVIAHHPLYVKQPDEDDGYYNLPRAKRRELLDLFEQSGVVAVLTGHTHSVVVNEYNGIQLVSGETTSRTHKAPLGFRLWHVTDQRPYEHVAVPLDAAPAGRAGAGNR